MGKKERLQPPVSLAELKQKVNDQLDKRGVDGNGKLIKIERVAWRVILEASTVMDSTDLVSLVNTQTGLTTEELMDIADKLPKSQNISDRIGRLMYARQVLVEDLKIIKPNLFKQLSFQTGTS